MQVGINPQGTAVRVTFPADFQPPETTEEEKKAEKEERFKNGKRDWMFHGLTEIEMAQLEFQICATCEGPDWCRKGVDFEDAESEDDEYTDEKNAKKSQELKWLCSMCYYDYNF